MGTPFDVIDHPSTDENFVRATAAQLKFLGDLMLRKAQIKGMDMGAAAQTVEDYLGTKLSKAFVSAKIDEKKAEIDELMRSVSTGGASEGHGSEMEDGYYWLDGDLVKVIHAVHGSGFQYARKAQLLGEKVTHEDGTMDPVTIDWVKVPGLLNDVRRRGVAVADDVEAAARFGRIYGKCGICTTTLTKPESIARGIGPVCWGRIG